MEVASVNYASLFAMELEKLLRITCEWQNHSLVSNIYVKHMSPKHYFKLYKQQEWTLKTLPGKQVFKNHNSNRFNLLQVCSSKPPFVLAVLFIPPFIVFLAVILLFHSIWCQFLLLDCGSLSRHSFFKQFRATSHTSSSLFYLRTYKFYISGTLKFRDSGNSSQGSIL